jgi:ParE toxin of type II toxin-antitoxin system, parDE
MLNQSPPGSPRSRTRQRSRCDFDSTGVAGNHSVSFPYGSPGLRRLRAGRYRVFYTIDEERRVVQIDHVARLP